MITRRTVLSNGVRFLVALLVSQGWKRSTATPPPPPLQPIAPAQLSSLVGWDDRIFSFPDSQGDRDALVAAIDHSLRYLQTSKAEAVYQKYAVPGITRDRVRRSLVRFRELLLRSRSALELQNAVRREFIFYQAIGKDGQGTVAFTGYFEPVYSASRAPTGEYRYPLYRRPPDFSTWGKPHPTRLQLEGADGLQGTKGALRGQELVWLRDRLEAFLIQVQGSARLNLIDGTILTVGYAGHTDYPYTGIGRELVKDGKLSLENLNLQAIVAYFRQNPQDLDNYLPRNQRFVFFRETDGAAATGSIGTPVIPERSIATDKSLFPPGALALIHTPLPFAGFGNRPAQRRVSRYVLDQDTGGAIIGPGRVDLFMGTGQRAGDRAGLVNATGQLYYLLLRE